MSDSRLLRSELNPQMASTIDDIRREGLDEWHTMSVDRARRLEDEVFSAGPSCPVDHVRNRSIPGPADDIPIRIYRPDTAMPAPVLVFYHGGGWVLGTLDSVGGICRMLATRTECIVVSVDYRLAPEHPFPAPVEDAYAALEWVAENAAAFGGDPDRLAVGGTSAGGNLAAVAALRARPSAVDLRHQLLCYPITDHGAHADVDGKTTDGHPDADRAGLLTRADMHWFWEQYLPDPADGANPSASPLRAEDLSGLPPTTVLTCGFDPLCEEGVAYADRLLDAGIDVEHAHYPTLSHGFLSLADSIEASDRAMDETVTTLRSHLH